MKFNTYEEMVEYMAANEKKPPEITSFFLDNVVITNENTDFVEISRIYKKYQDITGSGRPMDIYKDN